MQEEESSRRGSVLDQHTHRQLDGKDAVANEDIELQLSRGRQGDTDSFRDPSSLGSMDEPERQASYVSRPSIIALQNQSEGEEENAGNGLGNESADADIFSDRSDAAELAGIRLAQDHAPVTGGRTVMTTGQSPRNRAETGGEQTTSRAAGLPEPRGRSSLKTLTDKPKVATANGNQPIQRNAS